MATELIGLDEVEKIINQLPGEVQKKILTTALRNCGKPLLERAKSNLASAPNCGRLLSAMKIKAKRRSAARPGVFVGYYPQVTSSSRSQAAWEAMGAYWSEFGTMEYMDVPRSHKTRSLSEAQRRVGIPPSMRGRVMPVSWFRRAVDTMNQPTTEEFRKTLWKGMNSYFRRYARKIKWSGTQ